jgi:LysM repeat protein
MKIYKIESGDTLSQLAKYFDVSLSAIMFVNPTLINADNIIAGDWLYIPTILHHALEKTY